MIYDGVHFCDHCNELAEPAVLFKFSEVYQLDACVECANRYIQVLIDRGKLKSLCGA